MVEKVGEMKTKDEEQNEAPGYKKDERDEEKVVGITKSLPRMGGCFWFHV